MFQIAGASLDEVWGGKQSKPTRAKICKPSNRNSSKDKYEDIMDAYLDDFNGSCDLSYDKNNRDEISHSKYKGKFASSLNNYFNVTENAPKNTSFQNGSVKKCPENVMPVEYDQDAMEYYRYFKSDNMFQKVESESDSSSSSAAARGGNSNVDANVHTETEEEESRAYQEQVTQQEYNDYRNFYSAQQRMNDREAWEDQQQSQKSPKYLYIEMALYILSGIILIFLLEQILHLGLYLR